MKPSTRLLLVSAGAVLFNCIFWHEKIALNAVFFDVFILLSAFYLFPGAFKRPVVKWLMAAHLITIAAVLFHNTILSKIAFGSTLSLMIVFTQYRHRSVWYAGASALLNYLLVPISLVGSLKSIRYNKPNVSRLWNALRFLVIPLVLFCLFFLLYKFANPVLRVIISDLAGVLTGVLDRIFYWFNWNRSGFFMLGLFVTAGLLLKSSVSYFSDLDNNRKNELSRRKNSFSKWKDTAWFDLLSLMMGKIAGGMLALRNENTTGLISLILLNLLLLVINCIDVIYVWFGSTYNSNLSLSEYVHEGTGLLIFSILLAVTILLFFFRGNLNFYAKNKGLRYGAYAWLFQNAILAVSVLFRDYYYIAHYGLAYKRIGVLVFLVLVLAGLVSVFIKISQKKTTYYLLRVNAWFAIIMLVACSGIHWDVVIAEYNLSRKHIIVPDTKFLLTLSDKTLPLLQHHKEVFDKPLNTMIDIGGRSGTSPLNDREVFERRKNMFTQAQKGYSWLSWNAADAYIKKQLKLQAQQTTSGMSDATPDTIHEGRHHTNDRSSVNHDDGSGDLWLNFFVLPSSL